MFLQTMQYKIHLAPIYGKTLFAISGLSFPVSYYSFSERNAATSVYCRYCALFLEIILKTVLYLRSKYVAFRDNSSLHISAVLLLCRNFYDKCNSLSCAAWYEYFCNFKVTSKISMEFSKLKAGRYSKPTTKTSLRFLL